MVWIFNPGQKLLRILLKYIQVDVGRIRVGFGKINSTYDVEVDTFLSLFQEKLSTGSYVINDIDIKRIPR